VLVSLKWFAGELLMHAQRKRESTRGERSMYIFSKAVMISTAHTLSRLPVVECTRRRLVGEAQAIVLALIVLVVAVVVLIDEKEK
jgi:hypothetical protein